jgi:hypothetical protein
MSVWDRGRHYRVVLVVLAFIVLWLLKWRRINCRDEALTTGKATATIALKVGGSD